MQADYWYEGYCSQTGEWLRLPRTPLVTAIARRLMQQLADNKLYSREGKMYGVLLVETVSGEQQVLKAFSGLLNGKSIVEGWVPPIPGRDQVALEEARTLALLESLKQELIALQQIPERSQYAALSKDFEAQLQHLTAQHSQRKQERQQKRQKLLTSLKGEALEAAFEQLNEQSRQDGIERRRLKRKQNQLLQPLRSAVEQSDTRIRELKQNRKEISQQLQIQMHANYWLTNFAGETLPLQQLMPKGSMPTGTGDCCAPKLLHYAASHRLKPIAMAEFWWGPSIGDKIQGEFYGACAERCQPLMGFLLSGLSQNNLHKREQLSTATEISIIHEDEWLIAVNKPTGLLSVPGRYSDRQDSALTRLRYLLPEELNLTAVHRLDQDTSGILLFARDLHTYCQLSQQFQQRRVHKVYEAVVDGVITVESGVIDLPLWGDPNDRPYQKVDWQRGKPSVTKFQMLTKEGDRTRLECIPATGRTHQIRVHLADAQGLGVPILGDRLYGNRETAHRLHLHAKELRLEHPQTMQPLHLQTETPF